MAFSNQTLTFLSLNIQSDSTMASRRILTLQQWSLKRGGFTRVYSTQSSNPSLCSILEQQLESRVKSHFDFVNPAVAGLRTSFVAPDNRDIHLSHRTGSGVFVEPNLILTSAHVVARIATSYVAKPVDENKSSSSSSEQHIRICHKSYIGNTTALTDASKTGDLKMTPLAVNFGSDLAVLKVTDEEERSISRRCAVVAAKSPTVTENILFNIACRPDSPDYAYLKYGTFRSMGEKTVRAKAPWPLDDEEVKWMELNLLGTTGFTFPFGHPLCGDCSRGKKISGALSSVDGITGGSPWFNLDGEVVGVWSWDVEIDKFPLGYAVPYLCFKDILQYAKTKGPGDPVVMDRWIE